MKIISKAYDYYDTVAYTDSPIFVRHEKDYVDYSPPREIKDILDKAPYIYPHIMGSQEILIGFCGRVYPLVELSYSSDGLSVDHTFFCYSQKDILKFFSVTKLKTFSETYPMKTGRNQAYFTKKNMDILFGFHGKKIPDDIFFELKSPIFIVTRNERHIKKFKLTVNGSLKQYGFQKVFDPFQAYQEIEMYLGGVLGQTEINTVGISDKDLKHQKGFDKWSFKKMPTKRR